MTKKTFFLLALALAFALTPSLEAQNTTLRWNGRTLQGMSHRNYYIDIDNVKFGALHGGGNNRVVEILDGNGNSIPITNSKDEVISKTTTTTVDKIQKNDFESGIRYKITLSSNHYLEVSGTKTEKGGLVGPTFYVIKGPTEITIYYTDNWPKIEMIFSEKLESWVYEDVAGYKKDIVGQFVDEYIMPMVSYEAIREAYNKVRVKFWEYFNTTDTTKYNVCPENIGCLCGGNIPQHIIYGTTMKQGLMAGVLSGLNDAFGNFVGDKFETAFGDKFTKAYGEVAGETLDEASETVFKKAISDKIGNAFGDKLGDTAEAILRFEENSTKVPTILAAIIGYHYGYYDEETFESRFRDHAAVLYSDAPFPDGIAIAGKALRAVVDLCVDKIGDLMGIKLLTSVVSFAIDGISAAWDVSNIGYRADRFFQVSNTVVNWVPPAVTTGPTRWTAVPDSTFTTNTINSVAYGNNTWVAVGAGGMIAYSTDNGIKWTAVPAGTGSGQTTFPSNGSYSNISAVAFGNGKFVAVGSGRMATSPDGRTWKAVNSPLSGNWKEITFGGGRFVVVGDSGATAYSADGEYWTSVPSREAFRTLLISNNINDIAYGGGKFVAVGGGGKIGSSSNGQSWTNVANSAFGTLNNTINGIAYGNSKWVAAGQNGKMAYSDNGVSWNAVADGDNGEFGSNSVNGVGFGNNRFVAVGAGGKIAFSQDGGGWKAVPTTSNGGFGAIPIRAVTWGNGRFIAVGQMGKMAYSDWGEQSVIGERSGGGHEYSGPPAPSRITGPTNWNVVSNSTFGTSAIRGVAYGNNTWVAVGFGGKIAYSSDGRSWTAIPPDTSRDGGPSGFGTSNIHAVAFANNMFIAVGGRIAASPDGKTWTAVTQPRFLGDNSDFYGVAYGGGRWVAVAEGGRKAYSTNGRDWTAVDTTNAFNTDNNMHGVAFGNNRFVAIANKGKMAYSSNGTNWTAVSNTTFGNAFNTIGGIIYANNRWVAVGSNNIAYSSDGAAWTAVPTANRGFGGTSGSFNGVAFGKDRFVAVGNNGRIAYSADGAIWTVVNNGSRETENFGFRPSSINGFNAIAYGNGRFVAVGAEGRMAWADW